MLAGGQGGAGARPELMRFLPQTEWVPGGFLDPSAPRETLAAGAQQESEAHQVSVHSTTPPPDFSGQPPHQGDPGWDLPSPTLTARGGLGPLPPLVSQLTTPPRVPHSCWAPQNPLLHSLSPCSLGSYSQQALS